MNSLNWITPEIQKATEYHQNRLKAFYSGQQIDEVIAIAGRMFGHNHGLAGINEIDMLRKPDEWLDDVLKDMSQYAHESNDMITFKPLTIEIDPLGVHYIDAIFGADVYIHDQQTWSDQLDIDLDDLQMPDLSNNQVFQESLILTRKAVELTQGKIFITTPVLSCAINIGINLFGERLLESLITRPESAKRALKLINDVIIECTKAFFEIIPDNIRRNSVACNRFAPDCFGQIDGCATQLVSENQYSNFFAELDDELLSISKNGGMMHLCGTHTQHISTFRSMKNLRSIQINDRAAEDLNLYFNGLRSDQIIYVAPTASLSLDRILEITKGKRLILQIPLNEPISIKSL
ncbi:TPA: hypothetical protein ENS27_16945 [bacterium]|nr:hypothetical protein [bacterium]